MNTPFVLEIYTESTPNPESQKFVTNMSLLPNYVAEFKTKDSATESALAKSLFDIPFVSSIFISNDFITITKKPEYEWYEVTPEIREGIQNFIKTGKPVVSEKLYRMGEVQTMLVPDEEATPESKIKDLLDKYVKPAVENDGGHIAFRSFENGIVSLSLQGSCSGCPSSAITLKSGIEGLLKRMVPEVISVEAIAE